MQGLSQIYIDIKNCSLNALHTIQKQSKIVLIRLVLNFIFVLCNIHNEGQKPEIRLCVPCVRPLSLGLPQAETCHLDILI